MKAHNSSNNSSDSNSHADEDELITNLRQWYIRDKSNESKLPLNKSPTVSTEERGLIQSNSNDSLVSIIINKAQEKLENDSDDDINVLVEKKLFAKIISDHFKFYDLLHQILPPRAVEELSKQGRVMPEEFQSTTVFFSDIVGFTEITSKVDSLLVVKLLNQLYSLMDYIASLFPIFKVETVGDGYMIAGGMNNEEDDLHATHVADFAILVMQASSLVLSPYDNNPIKLRMGIHSGPVAAGVVGTVMPRYCLFGATVVTAHRMESNSEESRIQCSKDTATKILSSHAVVKRGLIDLKGLGETEAFWIVSMSEKHAKSLPFNVDDVLEKCQVIIESFSNNNIGRYPHLKDSNNIVGIDDQLRHERGVNSLHVLEIETSQLNSFESKKFIDEKASTDQKTLCSLVKSQKTVLNALIISDQPCIRLNAMYLLTELFSIDSYFCVATNISQTMTMKVLENRIDIILVEFNLYMTLDDGEREAFRSIITRRNRLLIMIEPDCDYQVELPLNDSWYHSLTYPFPSAAQLRSELEATSDAYANLLSMFDEPNALYQPSTAMNFNIMLICSSKSVRTLLKQQLSVTILEMEGFCISIDSFLSALNALESCCASETKLLYDIIIIDNALKATDIKACELLEFLRNQPTTKNSLIITLTNSALNNMALISSGSDIIWQKPLPSKKELGDKIRRLCKHKFREE